MKSVIYIVLLLMLIACAEESTAFNSCFEYSPESLIKIGDTVFFENCSQGANSYLWDFGDGTNSTLANPIHVYKTPGSFKVNLEANSSNGSSVNTQYVLIE